LILLLSFNCQPAAASDPAVSLPPQFTNSECEHVPGLMGDWDAHGDLTGVWTMQVQGKNSYRLVERWERSDLTRRAAINLCLADISKDLFFDANLDTLQGADRTPVLGNGDDFPVFLPLHFIGNLDVQSDVLHFLRLETS
jgi:hypothetical protein